MIKHLIGIDIGGANLKLYSSSGHVRSKFFPFWKQPENLAKELISLSAQMDSTYVGVTMTAELCDCFRTKREGVSYIVQTVETIYKGRANYWSTEGQFISSDKALLTPLMVAASNWHGLASYLSHEFPKGNWLLIDIGSTTTDLIPIQDGKITAKGKTDPERLSFGELIYTGVRRTPICGLLPHTAGEWFATTQDAYVLLDRLKEDEHDTATADNRPLTKEYAIERLLRCYLHDTETSSKTDAVAIAQEAHKAQQSLIIEGIKRMTQNSPKEWNAIVSGSGEFLGHEIVEQVGFSGSVSLASLLGEDVSEVAPAFAMAKLLEFTIG